MPYYAASGELTSFDHSGFAVEEATAGRFSNTYGIRSSTYVNSSTTTDYMGRNVLAGGPYAATFYHRFFYYMGSTFSRTNNVLMEYADNTGTPVPVFRLLFTNTSNVIQPQYWNGAAWVNIGATWTPAQNTLYKCDLTIVCGASFDLAVTNNMAIEPVSVTSGAAAMASVTNINRARSYSCMNASTNSLRMSEWLWGDEPTTGMRYALRPPTGDGTDTAGSGAFGDVDETVTNDADLSTLAANGDAETYTHSAMALPASGTVKAVQIEARVRNTGAGIANVKARLRVGATAYDQAANYSGISAAFSAYIARWTANPAGGAWTLTTAGQTSNEFGMLGQT